LIELAFIFKCCQSSRWS